MEGRDGLTGGLPDVGTVEPLPRSLIRDLGLRSMQARKRLQGAFIAVSPDRLTDFAMEISMDRP